MGSGLDVAILFVAGGWLILQVAAIWRFDGGWRTAAWIPAAAMALAISIAVLGVLAGSDLAPIWVVLALPLCLFAIALLWLAKAATWLVRGGAHAR